MSVLDRPLRWANATRDDIRVFESLQANVVKAHGRAHVRLLSITFGGREEARSVIRTLAGRITSAHDQLRSVELRSTEAPILSLHLSSRGFDALGFPRERVSSEAFARGMPPAREQADRPAVGPADALLLLACGRNPADPAPIESLCQEYRETVQSLLGPAGKVTVQNGKVLKRNGVSVEHFGYADGISSVTLLEDDLPPSSQRPDGSEWDPAAPASRVVVPWSWQLGGQITRDGFGSYLVYQKLEQNVEKFSKIASALRGAWLVGRFPDGTPLALADVPTDRFHRANYFNYGGVQGMACPPLAHIRAANPREKPSAWETPELFPRRGIPYDDRFRENEGLKPGVGLLFMGYNSRIEEQFEIMNRRVRNDDLMRDYVTVLDEAYYFAPPVEFLREIDRVESVQG